jgi:hypothetical protein
MSTPYDWLPETRLADELARVIRSFPLFPTLQDERFCCLGWIREM